MNRENPFSDVQGLLKERGFGALDGDAAKFHHTAHVRRADDQSGMTYQVACDNCGTVNEMTVSWDEFLFGMHGIAAPGWVYDPKHGGFHPNGACQTCRCLLFAVFTPDECQRQVKAGVAARALSPEYVARASQQLRATQAQVYPRR